MDGWQLRRWDQVQESPAGRLFLAVGPPVLAIAAAICCGWVVENGPSGWSRYVLGGAFLLAMATLYLLSLLTADFGSTLGYILGFALMVVVCFTVYPLTPQWLLRERGETIVCTVLEVDRQFDPAFDPTQPGLPNQPLSYHVHRLDCPDGGPSEMTTTDEAAGRVGQRIGVTIDPEGRGDPFPAEDIESVRSLVFVAGLALVTVLLRLGIVVVNLIDERRADRYGAARGRNPWP